jgi:hypothetical protein
VSAGVAVRDGEFDRVLVATAVMLGDFVRVLVATAVMLGDFVRVLTGAAAAPPGQYWVIVPMFASVVPL